MHRAAAAQERPRRRKHGAALTRKTARAVSLWCAGVRIIAAQGAAMEGPTSSVSAAVAIRITEVAANAIRRCNRTHRQTAAFGSSTLSRQHSPTENIGLGPSPPWLEPSMTPRPDMTGTDGFPPRLALGPLPKARGARDG